jgi:hypothetical protein
VESLREFLSRLISNRLLRVSLVTATQQEALFGPSALTTEGWVTVRNSEAFSESLAGIPLFKKKTSSFGTPSGDTGGN